MKNSLMPYSDKGRADNPAEAPVVVAGSMAICKDLSK